MPTVWYANIDPYENNNTIGYLNASKIHTFKKKTSIYLFLLRNIAFNKGIKQIENVASIFKIQQIKFFSSTRYW